VEDACASTWLILVAKQPACGERIFGWLCATALHEAYRLLRAERREPPSELYDERPAFVPPGRDDPETALEAKRALSALASLRERQRLYMAWQVGGYRYREIQELAGGATYTNVISGLACCVGSVEPRSRRRHVADGIGLRCRSWAARWSGVVWGVVRRVLARRSVGRAGSASTPAGFPRLRRVTPTPVRGR
jgi:hypothetical protein